HFSGCQVTATDGAPGPLGNKYRDAFHFAASAFYGPSVVNPCPIGDTFLNERRLAYTRDAFHVASGTRPPIVLDYELHAATDIYELVRHNQVNMQGYPIY